MALDVVNIFPHVPLLSLVSGRFGVNSQEGSPCFLSYQAVSPTTLSLLALLFLSDLLGYVCIYRDMRYGCEAERCQNKAYVNVYLKAL